MPIQIKVKADFRLPVNFLRVMQFRVRHMEPALFKGGTYMEAIIDRRFNTKYAPFQFGAASQQRWARNAPSTIKRKGHSSVLIGGGPHAGKLRRGIKSVVRPMMLIIQYPFYGEFHMKGFFVWKNSKSGKSKSQHNVPARPFAYPSKKDLQYIVNAIARYIVRGSP